ncbi:hypothetical protein PCE1_000691 [Barthelona sp. PCE]
MATKCTEALSRLEEQTGIPIAELDVVKLLGLYPAIEKMDSSLSKLSNCEQLSMSTNAIERIGSLQGLHSLKILSLGRNQIKRIENLDAVAGTLEQLWLSHNNIERLTGLSNLQNLKILFVRCNRISSLSEIDRLVDLASLEELDLRGNPIVETLGDNWRPEVLRRLRNLKTLDGIAVTFEESQLFQS